jgi:hypothetical protein
MKSIHSMITVVLLASTLPAQAAQTDPELLIYRASGVIDDGSGSFAGVATAFHCTPVSGVTENIRFVVRNVSGGIVANTLFAAPHLQTLIVSTHLTEVYGFATISPGIAFQGTVAIAATSSNVLCTGKTINAQPSVPSGFILPMVSFNPMPGTQE